MAPGIRTYSQCNYCLCRGGGSSMPIPFKRLFTYFLSRRFLVGLFLGSIVGCWGEIGCEDFSNAQGLKITREWARLAPYPEGVRRFNVRVTGSMFTRQFKVDFELPRPEIDAWLAACPGIQDAKVDQRGRGLKHYEIKPGGGAQHAEMTVNEEKCTVSINVYWS